MLRKQIYFRNYYRNNRERLLAKYKERYKKHRETVLAAKRLCLQRSPEKIREQRSKSRKKNIKRILEASRRQRAALRDQAIAILGGKCVACGYDKDFRAIQVDHINGDGWSERRSVGNYKIYRSIVSLGHQGKYQPLCANCNVIKRMDLGEHQRQFRSVM